MPTATAPSPTAATPTSVKSWVHPETIQPQVKNSAGRFVDVPDWNNLPSEARRGITDANTRTRAKQYEGALDKTPPINPNPSPAIDTPPTIVDEIPMAMEQRSIEAQYSGTDHMPAEADPLSLIPSEAPDEFYREFREGLSVKAGDEAMNTRAAIRAMEPPEQERLISGAKTAVGDTESERLWKLLNEDTVADAAPPPIPAAAGGGIGKGAGRGNIRGTSPRGRGPGRGGPVGRFGAPSVHREIKVGGYSFPSLPDVDDAFASMRHDNTWQHMADRLSKRFPALVRVVNASGTLATAPIEARGAIAVEVLRERMNRGLAPMFAQLDRIGDEVGRCLGRRMHRGASLRR